MTVEVVEFLFLVRPSNKGLLRFRVVEPILIVGHHQSSFLFVVHRVRVTRAVIVMLYGTPLTNVNVASIVTAECSTALTDPRSTETTQVGSITGDVMITLWTLCTLFPYFLHYGALQIDHCPIVYLLQGGDQSMVLSDQLPILSLQPLVFLHQSG